MNPTIPPDYCFFWIDHWSTCMQKSEWASWVQAFGAIAAIIGAAWIAGDQERKRILSQKQAAISKARTFAGSLLGAAEGIRERGGIVLINVRAHRVVLEELVQDSRGIAPESLHLTWIAAVSALRSIGVQMAQAVRDAETPEGKSGSFDLVNRVKYQNMLETVAELESRALTHSETLKDDHPGVRRFDKQD